MNKPHVILKANQKDGVDETTTALKNNKFNEVLNIICQQNLNSFEKRNENLVLLKK